MMLWKSILNVPFISYVYLICSIYHYFHLFFSDFFSSFLLFFFSSLLITFQERLVFFKFNYFHCSVLSTTSDFFSTILHVLRYSKLLYLLPFSPLSLACFLFPLPFPVPHFFLIFFFFRSTITYLTLLPPPSPSLSLPRFSSPYLLFFLSSHLILSLNLSSYLISFSCPCPCPCPYSYSYDSLCLPVWYQAACSMNHGFN